jgi:hypothetical protein
VLWLVGALGGGRPRAVQWQQLVTRPTHSCLCVSRAASGGRAGLSAQADAGARARLAGVLTVAVKAVSLAGLLAVTFGPCYSYTLLRAVYSQRWAATEAPTVLGCYTAYLLLLAVNGASHETETASCDGSTEGVAAPTPGC